MHLLDTDMLSRLHAGDARLEARRRQFDPLQLGTTIVTRIEILRGRFEFLLKAANGEQLQRACDWLERSERLLRQIRVVSVDEGVAAQFDRLRQNRKLKKIGRADLLIAAIALSNDATLVTANLRHFRQAPGLRVENWLE